MRASSRAARPISPAQSWPRARPSPRSRISWDTRLPAAARWARRTRILAEHASVGDKRIVELEAAAALAREKVSLLETEKGSLQTSLEQTLAETTRLSRRLAESETALTAARARLEQLERSLAASEENRKKLSAACDEANERRQSECYAVNLKLDAMRSRAATAEKLLAEVRQSVVGRTEEIRATERRVVDSAVALSASEKKNERLPPSARRRAASSRSSSSRTRRCWSAPTASPKP